MNKYTLSVGMMFFLGSACAQENISASVFNNYNHTLNFNDHKIVFQLQPIKQLPKLTDPTKKYHWYSNNQLKITQGGYSGKLLNGSYTDFHFNNNLKEKGVFKMGLKIGEWKKWNIEGKLSEIANFKDGILHGPFYQYNLSGDLQESGNYKNGKMDGEFRKYIKQDSIETSKYKDGKFKLEKPSWLKRQFKKEPKLVTNKTL
jgi:antitoxin component YwqK of YwqJK toxin-antitoxin module